MRAFFIFLLFIFLLFVLPALVIGSKFNENELVKISLETTNDIEQFKISLTVFNDKNVALSFEANNFELAVKYSNDNQGDIIASLFDDKYLMEFLDNIKPVINKLEHVTVHIETDIMDLDLTVSDLVKFSKHAVKSGKIFDTLDQILDNLKLYLYVVEYLVDYGIDINTN